MDTYSELVADTVPVSGSPQPRPSLDDSLWYKDAIIYQVHVKAFYDSNGNGIGDFRGLTEKLDYRHGVRTPMQWSPDRNAGFSRADPQSLYPPPIMDAVHGFQSVNVEAQSRSQSSPLQWTRRLIAACSAHPAFARGTLRLVRPGNRKAFRELIAMMGQPTGELHMALAATTGDSAFDPEPVSVDDVAAWIAQGASSFPAVPEDMAARLIELFVLEKALYEVRYEPGSRPDWVWISLAGLLERLQRGVGSFS